MNRDTHLRRIRQRSYEGDSVGQQEGETRCPKVEALTESEACFEEGAGEKGTPSTESQSEGGRESAPVEARRESCCSETRGKARRRSACCSGPGCKITEIIGESGGQSGCASS